MADEIKNTNENEVKNNEAPQEDQQAPEQKGSENQADLQSLMVEIAKLKRANDALSSENKDWKAKYKETLSAQEQASMEKAEAAAKREEQFQQLLKENTVNKYEKSFLGLGYDEKQAHDAAVAQYDGDFDTLHGIQKAAQEAAIKKAEAEWIKSRPQIQTGNQPEEEDWFLKGLNSVKTRF